MKVKTKIERAKAKFHKKKEIEMLEDKICELFPYKCHTVEEDHVNLESVAKKLGIPDLYFFPNVLTPLLVLKQWS